jgi:aspartyl-tRNA(Asn)/glutamyl-tRNA(Gln) amidotransferase subunit A
VTDLADLTAIELLSLFESAEASPVDAVNACLRRMELVDGEINAVLTRLPEEAAAQARESEFRWRSGTARPLEGVPYGLKDVIATAGVATTGGSALYRTHVPDYDAALAERLSAAGGVRLVKLQTFEFACGGAENQTFGYCRNPWDHSRTTGGSSSGSGAAVASGQVPIAIGTDTGGSIRQPAAYCGITGLKPTYGRVPRHGVMPLSWTLDHAGPMTRSVADAALVLGVIAGHDPRDATSSVRRVPDYAAAVAAPPSGLVVGRPRGWFEDRLTPEVATAFERSMTDMAGAGIRVVDISLTKVDLWEVAAWQIMYAEMLSLHQEHASDVENRDAMGRGMLAAAPYVHAVDYLRALRYRRVAQEALSKAMGGVVALVTPSATSVAPPLDAISGAADSAEWLATSTRTTLPFNYTGNPALCVPAGLIGGLPTSIQFVARPHDEQALFALGAAYQLATTHHTLRPPWAAASL